MSQLQQGRYDALLRRVADLKGPGSKVNDVLEELFPMFDVENMQPELFILAQTDLCYGGAVIAAVVGESIRGQLFNPVGSGKILTVTQAGYGATGNSVVRWGRQDNAISTRFTTELFRDTRKQTGAVLSLPVGQIRGESSVALANATGQTRLTANVGFVLQDANGVTILAPGTGFEIGQQAQNVGGHFYFYWKERVAEPSELNF